ncbi:hypothetical protein [Paraflavitalea pollutisoli]|uniref:hypothetical protein n=1 Tax=Paraflavitalea pollutisoli TaxID=3034143 RepID=UPI0023EC1AE8|nr:hypothetical protein [Paraflavitalea sp. H1-2-19X]
MQLSEVGLVLIKVSANDQDAIHMKIYRDSTVCRYGAGGLPQLGITGMSYFGDARFFDPIIAQVPEELLAQPINYEEPTPNGSLEYVVAFFGESTNGETDERAEWSKSTGIRIKIDQRSGFNHPIMGFLDNLTMVAAELTNEWYFDIMVKAQYNMSSSTLPILTFVTQPRQQAEIENNFGLYINQMLTSARRWSLASYDQNKTYEKDDLLYRGVIEETPESFRMEFRAMNGPLPVES